MKTLLKEAGVGVGGEQGAYLEKPLTCVSS